MAAKSITLVALTLCYALSIAAAATATPVTANPPTAAPVKTLTPQQQRLKRCNQQADARQLKGNERKSFMSTCLKAS